MYQKSSEQYHLDGSREADQLALQSLTKHGKHNKFAKGILALLRGYRKPTTVQRDTYAAYQVFTATTSGDFTLTINGVDTVVSFDTSQTVTASAAVTALNALASDALAYGGRSIEADNRKATITLTSCAVGTYFDICGVRITAVQKVANGPDQFEISGTDTADAQKLVAAIKAHPVLQDLVCADNSSGVVTVRSRRASTPARDLAISGSGESVSAAVLTASTVVCVSCVRKGHVGNWITTAVTGTGAAVGAARMTGGVTVHETL